MNNSIVVHHAASGWELSAVVGGPARAYDAGVNARIASVDLHSASAKL